MLSQLPSDCICRAQSMTQVPTSPMDMMHALVQAELCVRLYQASGNLQQPAVSLIITTVGDNIS